MYSNSSFRNFFFTEKFLNKNKQKYIVLKIDKIFVKPRQNLR